MTQMPDDILYDLRLVERHMNRGLISAKDLEKRLNQCDDLVDQSSVIAVDEPVREGEASAQEEEGVDEATE